MPEYSNSVAAYVVAMSALLLVFAYYIVIILAQHLFAPKDVLVSRYEAPSNVFPDVAAWLFDNSDLPRSMVAAMVNMAAKQYVRIEQNGDLYSLYQLGPAVSLSLEPEEDALARTLFKGFDCFDFAEATPQLREAVEAFRWALIATNYFSQRTSLFVPAWIVSGLGLFFAIGPDNIVTTHFNLQLLYFVAWASGFFIASVRTLPGSFKKAASRSPTSTAPRRPWTGADRLDFGFLGIALIFILLIWFWSNIITAFFAAAFLGVNAVFFLKLRGGLTTAGRKAISQIVGFKAFLAEVDSDVISRTNSPETAPPVLDQKHAYAIAFNLDLGWGEQFVSAIAPLVAAAQKMRRKDIENP